MQKKCAMHFTVLLVFQQSIVYLALLNIYGIDTVDALLFSSNLTCYCNNKNQNGHSQRKCRNNQCVSNAITAVCYSKIVDENGTFEKGCIFRSYCYKGGQVKKCNMACCYDPMCNQHRNKTGLEYRCRVPPIPTKPGEKNKTRQDEKIAKELVAVIVAIPLSLIIIVAMVIITWKYFRNTNAKYNNALLKPTADKQFVSDGTEYSSGGSGTGLPLLAQQTIAFQIVLQECVSKGKFGIVYRATWQQEDVAVKIFSTGEETSWYCEREMYQTTMIRHENILGFIAADSKDTGTSTEYWLICEYHPKGSLFNYLQTEVLDIYIMLKMVCSIASGLNHLHMQIVGNQAKPPIAHRDMKTKNILVKNDNTCCIADLGLAITRTSVNEGSINSSRTGTRRYHSPELLNDSMDTTHFDSYLKADVYALGLCVWEICWRTKTGHELQEYQLPYFDHVPVNPSEEDMLKAVCTDERRPTFPDYWNETNEMKILMKLMSECWCSEAAARLPTLRIKKNIIALCERNQIPV